MNQTHQNRQNKTRAKSKNKTQDCELLEEEERERMTPIAAFDCGFLTPDLNHPTGASEWKGPTTYSLSFLVGSMKDLGFRRIILKCDAMDLGTSLLCVSSPKCAKNVCQALPSSPKHQMRSHVCHQMRSHVQTRIHPATFPEQIFLCSGGNVVPKDGGRESFPVQPLRQMFSVSNSPRPENLAQRRRPQHYCVANGM